MSHVVEFAPARLPVRAHGPCRLYRTMKQVSTSAMSDPHAHLSALSLRLVMRSRKGDSSAPSGMASNTGNKAWATSPLSGTVVVSQCCAACVRSLHHYARDATLSLPTVYAHPNAVRVMRVPTCANNSSTCCLKSPARANTKKNRLVQYIL